MSMAILVAAGALGVLMQGGEAGEYRSVEGEHIILKVRADDLKVLKDPADWVAKLDRAYDAYADLVGTTPFGGKKITILSVEDDPGGWAVAGNPIRWHRKWVASTLENVNKGDWVFGIMHEIGHDFDLDDRWNWDAELLANFKMDYAILQAKGVAFFDDHICDYADPKSLHLNDLYRIHEGRRGMTEWMQHGGFGEDASHSKWTDTVTDLGWEPFKKAFRWFNGLKEDQSVPDGLSRRSLFIRALEEQSGDGQVGARFVDWGFSHLVVDAPTADEAARILHNRTWHAEVPEYVFRVKAGEQPVLRIDVTDRQVKRFAKGLGTHAKSVIVFDLGGRYATFDSLAGVPGKSASEGRWGSVDFEVVGDGKTLYRGAVLRGGGMYETIHLDVAGVKQLKLVVNDGGNGIWGDGCAWVDTKVTTADGKTVYLSDLKPVSAEQGYEKLKMDRDIDGNPLEFLYGPSSKKAEIVATVEGKSVTLAPVGDGVRYEGMLPALSGGKHFVRVTIRVGEDKVTQHEMATVFVGQ